MVYTMEIYTDGGCRRNGWSRAIGAAAAAFKNQNGRYVDACTQSLPSWPPPTNQRAELTGIIIALEQALERYHELDSDPYLRVTIYSDSRYAVKCMTTWINKWLQNGWLNAAGDAVANRDLIERAFDLGDRLKREGNVNYVWIPRKKNEYADQLCNEDMDQQ